MNNPRPSNEYIKQQAQRANEYAQQNEDSKRRGSGTFEDLELDQAQTPDRVDQSNWSWKEGGNEQYHEGKFWSSHADHCWSLTHGFSRICSISR